MPLKAVQQIMLGKVLKNERQARETLAAIKSAGYDGIELCGFMIHPTPLIVRLLTKAAGMPSGNGGKFDWHALIKEAGLVVPSIHTDLGSVERDAKSVSDEVLSFGSKYAVITGMYRFDYSSSDEVHALAQRLNDAGKKLKADGVNLIYHNHNCELFRCDGVNSAYDVLIDETDPEFVNFEFDSYWFTDGGADVQDWMRKLGSRMKLWHVTDRGSRQQGPAMTPILKCDSVELGTGNMDLDGLKEIALQNGAQAVVLESHKNWIDKDPIKSLEKSAEWLNGRL